MKIAFFDSGIGGITVLRESLKQLPHEDYIYYADTCHAPYGVKPKDEARKYIFEAVDFLAQQGIDALVIACNTATSIAVKDLRLVHSFPIIGMEPAVKPAVERNGSGHKRVLVTATPLTLKEEKYHNLVERVDRNQIVDSLPLPELVEFAENFNFHEEIIAPYLRRKLASFDLSIYGTVVLGCTHFPLFAESFKKVLPSHIDIIDGSAGTVRRLKNVLEEKGSLGHGSGEIIFYTSSKLEEDGQRLEEIKKLLK